MSETPIEPMQPIVVVDGVARFRGGLVMTDLDPLSPQRVLSDGSTVHQRVTGGIFVKRPDGSSATYPAGFGIDDVVREEERRIAGRSE